ncbi:MAG: Asp-tRNA(Asn)/Glu-tRNA(Gln) amidotransferase subunit GatB [Chloroflexi bacterium]|nr:Asp-tRNA(Asn)/Glu-tRNA(Gln) amidotransferase subunit GatB [Chloroflexota bacterium]
MEYETIIGLEVHAQLLTRSKMYCGCSADYAAAPPNTHVCPVCLGMPGVLPTINRQAVEYTIMTALALNCTVQVNTKFDRKNYAYPDLMKGYQISQYDAPFGTEGWLTIEADGQKKRLGIIRVHLEEDVAKLTHRAATPAEAFAHRTRASEEAYSLVDVNRAGAPLMEIVGCPDIRSPEEARQYLVKLRTILQYLGVSTGNMEEGSFRCDANISLRPMGTQELMPKVEVKNMNSFKAVYRALEYEVERQKKVWDTCERVVQETRGWLEEKGVTVSQRSKEQAHDYRYFPEPDLPPLVVGREWVDAIREKLPELPEDRRDRFVREYALSAYDAGLLTGSKAMADYFEACVKEAGVPKTELTKKAKEIANWLLGEFIRLLNVSNIEINTSKIRPKALVELLKLLEQGKISSTAAKTVFEEMFKTGKPAAELVASLGLAQLSDAGELARLVGEVLVKNPQAVGDFKAGKEQAIGFLVGQVMRATRGRADARTVGELIKARLAG